MNAIPPIRAAALAEDLSGLELGYDIPALPGMAEAEVLTPCLAVDLDALERNLATMAGFVKATGLRLRAHGKMHRSVAVALLQVEIGGASGICCQKVAEAEAFVRGGIRDVLVSNEVRDPARIDRLARLPLRGASVTVCVDDVDNVADLSAAAATHGTELGCLVEIDIGAGRCGARSPAQAVEIARAIEAAPGLRYEGLQAYQGEMQHIEDHAAREAAFDAARDRCAAAVEALAAAGLAPAVVSGAGTGSFRFEAESGLWTELQCGSYAFMDAAYGAVRDAQGRRLDEAAFENALFVLTSVISRRPGIAVCDAGLKSMSMESGLPRVFGREGVAYTRASDEHGVLSDPSGALAINARLRLVPGHCDPTCNLHDRIVVLRGGRVEALWRVDARGRSF